MATTARRPSSEQLVTRLKRAEGQIRGVQRMIEEGSDAQQVLTQLAAVKAAVDQVGIHLMSERLRTCVADGDEGCAEAFEDAMATLLRFASLGR